MVQLQDMALFALLVLLCGLLVWTVARSVYQKRLAVLQQERVKLATHNQNLEQQAGIARQKGAQLSEARLVLVRQKAGLESRLEAMQSRLLHLEACESDLTGHRSKLAQLQQQWVSREVSLTKDLALARQQLTETSRLRDDLMQAYRQLSAQALQENTQTLVQQAEQAFSKYWQGARQDLSHQTQTVQQTIAPLQTALSQYETHLHDLEASRQKAYGGLLEKLGGLSKAQLNLERETTRLIQSLRAPQVKGRWGEISLRRAVEMAGLNNYCDFTEQPSRRGNGGQNEIRPDMVISLPQQRTLVLDAKVSLSAFMDAQATDDPERQRRLLHKHARQLRQHVRSLSAKAYWRQFTSAPDFVVMFVPGENFFSAALQVDPQLIDDASRKNIIIATPTTLISLLKTVSYVWHQDQAGQNAKQILEAGRTLFERAQTLSTHFSNLGQDLTRCVSTYNRTVASYERRLLVSANRLQQLGVSEVGNGPLSAPQPITTSIRKPNHVSIPKTESPNVSKSIS